MTSELFSPNDLMLIAAVHASAALYMCGLIWFVQVVHYPLHGLVGTESFIAYQREHVRRTSWVVIAPMLIELTTSVLLVAVLSKDRIDPLATMGFLLLLKAWLATFLLSVPAHRKLEQSFSTPAHKQLVYTNWVRTFAWTLRAPIAMAMLVTISRGVP